jgi:hypothetical protein
MPRKFSFKSTSLYLKNHCEIIIRSSPILLANKIIDKALAEGNNDEAELGKKQLAAYQKFHKKEVFQKAVPLKQHLNFASSTDDKLLGSHDYLEQMYPEYNKKIFMDNSGHHFIRFEEIMPDIGDLIGEKVQKMH